MKPRYFLPLLGFVLPTAVIGFGFVIPSSCVAGVNQLTIGFATSILGACVTYSAGVRAVYPNFDPSHQQRRCSPGWEGAKPRRLPAKFLSESY